MLNIIAIGCEAASGEPCFLFSQAAFAAPLRSGHFRNGRDVDQQIRLGQPEVQARAKRLAAGKHLAKPGLMAEQLDRRINAGRSRVVECTGFIAS
jgi:hypothetical protein